MCVCVYVCVCVCVYTQKIYELLLTGCDLANPIIAVYAQI